MQFRERSARPVGVLKPIWPLNEAQLGQHGQFNTLTVLSHRVLASREEWPYESKETASEDQLAMLPAADCLEDLSDPCVWLPTIETRLLHQVWRDIGWLQARLDSLMQFTTRTFFLFAFPQCLILPIVLRYPQNQLGLHGFSFTYVNYSNLSIIIKA